MKRIGLTTVAFLALTTVLSAQIMNSQDNPEPKAKAVTPGPVSPYFWIGGQSILVAGKDFQSGASGLSWSPNSSWASFNVALVDSHYDIPKKYVVGEDPSIWSAYFRFSDPTAKFNSYSSGPELNWPTWSAGFQGQGFHFNLLVQGDDSVLGGTLDNKPVPAISGASQVLYLAGKSALTSNFLSNPDPVVSVNYGVKGLASAGYEVPEWGKVFLTAGSLGSPSSAQATNGWAGALNFEVTPLGTPDFDRPLTFRVTGDAVAGSNNKAKNGNGADLGNPVGFGLAGQVDWMVDDDVVFTPQLAFDGRLNDSWTPGLALPVGSNRFDWKAGGGFLVSFSPKRYVSDEYSELPTQGAKYQNFEYEKILKYSYVQALLDYSRSALTETSRDLALTFKIEEPDGTVGYDENLGFMAEFRVAHLGGANPGLARTWASAGRVSYDLANHQVAPYLRLAYDSEQVLKFRTGVQVSPVRGCALEVTYMTPNLTGTGGPQNAGRLEFLVGISTDSSYVRTLKNMDFAYTGM